MAKSLTEFKKHLNGERKIINEYKELLKVCKEEEMDWYEASQTVFNYVHPEVAKPTANDYKTINKLRKWYAEEGEI